MKAYLFLDYETRSEADLKKVGSWVYSTHKSTEILCVAWKIITIGRMGEIVKYKTKSWTPMLGGGCSELLSYLCNPKITLVAHNAFFEQVITRNVLSRVFPHPELKSIPHDRWICTAATAAALALPRKLEHACLALGLTSKKDMEGHRLMLKMTKPRRETKNNKNKWHATEEDLKRLRDYCVADIKAEVALFCKIPKLNPKEYKTWVLDQEINFRGFEIDRPLVLSAIRLIERAEIRLNERLYEITNGRVETTTKRQALLDAINESGIRLPNLTKDTVETALSYGDLDDHTRELLSIRQASAKTSIKKYEAFLNRVSSDNRVRDILKYHSASTGRWSSTGVQIHNFPNKKVPALDTLLTTIKNGNLDELELLFGDPLNALSLALRSVILPSDGCTLFVDDFSAIEARVLLWLANDQNGLDIFIKNQDPYRATAARLFGIAIEDVTDEQRQIGKAIELGCGFGMGDKKFFQTCLDRKVKGVTEELAKLGVKVYRDIHTPVVQFWYNTERAAIHAVKTGNRASINKVTWFTEGDFLYCELPSKRRLAYHKPEIRMKMTPWGENKETLYHWSEHPKTKKWVCEGTYGGRLVENIVQATARDFMSEAMYRVSAANYKVLFTVHDEVVAMKKDGDVKEFRNLMQQIPSWGSGCPIKTEGWTGFRYRK